MISQERSSGVLSRTRANPSTCSSRKPTKEGHKKSASTVTVDMDKGFLDDDAPINQRDAVGIDGVAASAEQLGRSCRLPSAKTRVG